VSNKATVLFSDIREFTTLSEGLAAEKVMDFLNQYFTLMVDEVFRHKGVLDKYMGDALMAFFGAPLAQPDHAARACRAALAMRDELVRLNEGWHRYGKLPPHLTLGIGIGLNSGEMSVGNVGSEVVFGYTVIGDNVNLGSRLESLNKDHRTRIIISDATRTELTGAYQLRPLGDVVVKGKTRAVAIFEVVVPSPIPALHEDAQT